MNISSSTTSRLVQTPAHPNHGAQPGPRSAGGAEQAAPGSQVDRTSEGSAAQSAGRARVAEPQATARGRHDRVQSAAEGISARIDHMIENGDLSSDQVKALEEAKSTLTSMMQRLGDAFFNGGGQSRGHLASAFEKVLDSVANAVNEAVPKEVREQRVPSPANAAVETFYGPGRMHDTHGGAGRGVDAVG